jgi:hypothetical protein
MRHEATNLDRLGLSKTENPKGCDNKLSKIHMIEFKISNIFKGQPPLSSFEMLMCNPQCFLLFPHGNPSFNMVLSNM